MRERALGFMPNWEVFTKLSPLEIQIHWVTVVLAFIFGLIIFSQKKGTGFHKTVGWLYVIAMAITVVSAFFIRNPDGITIAPGLSGFSVIHLFIPLTTIGIAGALVAIKTGNVRKHSRRMILTFIGALMIAGLFTFLPGRRMNEFFFGDLQEVHNPIDSHTARA